MINVDVRRVFDNLDTLNSSMRYDKSIKNIYTDNEYKNLVYEKKVKDNTAKITLKQKAGEDKVFVYFDFDIDSYNSTCIYDPSSDFKEWECTDSDYSEQLKPVFEAVVNKLVDLIDDADYISRVFNDVVNDLEKNLR